MTLNNKIILGASLVTLVAALMFGAFIGGKRVADREARLVELNNKIAQLEQANRDLQVQRVAIQNDTLRGIGAIRSQAAKVTTPSGAIDAVNAQTGTHIEVQQPKDGSGEPLPDAPPIGVIPNEDIWKVFNYTLAKQECDVRLAGCQKEVTNLEAQVANATQAANLQKEATKIEAKKHGFWGKVKWFVIGGAIGGTAAYLGTR